MASKKVGSKSNTCQKFSRPSIKYGGEGQKYVNRLGGCEATCQPRKPKVTDSIPAGVDRFTGCENRRHACYMIM
ncbi:hypothetical protein TNCV_1822391 [Trichonephila clavipes]|nr:hypothetical protein TNCV_1822391 [Trichonephila clavipes]